MTPDEYRRLVAALGLSVYGSAKVLGISERTTRRYVSGETPIAEPVAKLLRSLVEKREADSTTS